MARNRKKTRPPRGKKEPRNVRDNDRLTDSGALSKADRLADDRDRRDYAKSKHNDPAWYAQNPQLMRDYASFPFGVPIGIQLPEELGYASASVPGVIALYYAPTIGTAQAETDPINIAARNIYSFVRHANSGHSNYDSPDLMLYLIAMDSIYMYHAFLKRALGVIMDYTPVNRYYPRALISAMGIDPDDLMAHIADFRGFINQYAVQIGSMCVPNSMSYMARHSWMTEGLYTDSTAAKAQTYMYVPYNYYKFKAIQSDNTAVGSLERVSLFNPNASGISKLTVAQLITFGQNLLTPIITNEDLNIMSGDILKAFGADGVVKISGVMDGYMVLPVYSQEVLSQIENCVILASGGSLTGTVTQNTAVGGGYLVATDDLPSIYLGAGPITAAGALDTMTGSRLINFHHDGVTPDEVMVATRLTPGLTVDEATGEFTFDSVGSECVMYANVWYYGKDASGNVVLQKRGFASVMPIRFNVTGQGTDAAYLSVIAQYSNFDWAPAVALVAVDMSKTPYVVTNPTSPILDIDNYTVLSKDNLRNLHMAALLSEFSVPQMGSFSKSI